MSPPREPTTIRLPGADRRAPSTSDSGPAGTQRIPLSRARIVDAAIELIESEGPEALSMRRLADRLGSSTMATYHHVADRQALMEAIAERLLDELPPGPTHSDWQGVVKARVHAYLELSRRHPATFATLLRSRPTALVTQVTDIAAELVGTGLDEPTAQRVVRTTVRYLMGTVLGEGTADPSIISQEELDDLFDFGVTVLLAGFERTLASEAPPEGADGRSTTTGPSPE